MPKSFISLKINEKRKKKSQHGTLTVRTFTHSLIKNRESNNKITHIFFNSFIFEVDKTSLWHCRLGHPSPQRLALLQSFVPDVITCNINKSFDCYVYPLAK